MAQKQKIRIEKKVKNIQAYSSGEISKSEAVRRGRDMGYDESVDTQLRSRWGRGIFATQESSVSS